jgi:hypothetical protein
MPDWILIAGGCMFVVFGVTGLWQGVARLRGGDRDPLGMPAPVLVMESSGMLLLAAAVLLGEPWLLLAVPGGVLMAAGETDRIRRRWRARRRR